MENRDPIEVPEMLPTGFNNERFNLFSRRPLIERILFTQSLNTKNISYAIFFIWQGTSKLEEYGDEISLSRINI